MPALFRACVLRRQQQQQQQGRPWPIQRCRWTFFEWESEGDLVTTRPYLDPASAKHEEGGGRGARCILSTPLPMSVAHSSFECVRACPGHTLETISPVRARACVRVLRRTNDDDIHGFRTRDGRNNPQCPIPLAVSLSLPPFFFPSSLLAGRGGDHGINSPIGSSAVPRRDVL